MIRVVDATIQRVKQPEAAKVTGDSRHIGSLDFEIFSLVGSCPMRKIIKRVAGRGSRLRCRSRVHLRLHMHDFLRLI
jgi:hypothetical protein